MVAEEKKLTIDVRLILRVSLSSAKFSLTNVFDGSKINLTVGHTRGMGIYFHCGGLTTLIKVHSTINCVPLPGELFKTEAKT